MIRFAFLTLSLLCFGCSALGLTDVTPQESPCRDCAELNAIEPPGACMSWQCGPGGMCVVGPTDGDGDGAPLEACTPAGSEPDCDDEDANSFPRVGEMPAASELPDGRDNDCDGTVDESVGFTLDADSVGSQVDFASWSDADGELLAIASADNGLSVRLLTREDGAPAFLNLVAAAAPSENLRASGSVALAPVGEDIVVAGDDVRAAGFCQDPYVGRAKPPAAGVEVPFATESVAGFPRSGLCDDGVNPDPNVLGAIALAAHDTQRALLVGVEGGGDRASCGSTGTGPATALVLRSPSPSTLLDAVEERSVVLGDNAGLGGPAALAIPDDAPVFRYLVAFADDAGGVQIHRVQSVSGGGGGTVVESELLHTETSCGAACGDVALAATTLEGVRIVGLAYRAGSCASPELRFRRFEVSASGITPMDAAPVSSPAAGVSAVALSARATSPEWALAYATGGIIEVQLIDADGLRGAPAGGFTGENLPSVIEGAIGLSYTDDRIELGFVQGSSLRFARLPLR